MSDISIDVLQELDISGLRGQGLQPGEQELPEGQAQAQPEVQIDEAVVSQLADMGFPVEGCKKAVYHTQNSGVEAAMNWVMQHMEDPDFGLPFEVPGAKKSSSAFVPNEEALVMVMSMGFSKEQATKALKNTDNNVERAVEWIFSHAEELDQPMETEEAGQSQAGAAPPNVRDGAGKYKLVAFISHMGTSTMVGHYVCHILKEGRWVIFNDEKVALSEHPPMDLAYMYLYKRI